jgi:hypothetical protein
LSPLIVRTGGSLFASGSLTPHELITAQIDAIETKETTLKNRICFCISSPPSMKTLLKPDARIYFNKSNIIKDNSAENRESEFVPGIHIKNRVF